MARRDDPELGALLDRFACVRVVQAFGLDLARFQFDWGLTFAVVGLNADGTIYGRYGSRRMGEDGHPSAVATIEGLKAALKGMLDLHGAYPGNRAELEGKTGAAPPWGTPESMPDNAGRPNMKPADGSRGGCVHCHQAHEGILWSTRAAAKPLPDSVVRPWPMPDRVGLSLDPREAATVDAVAPGSPAEKAGFRPRDRIRRIGGQVPVSIADVQWVLQEAKVPGTLKVEVSRGAESAALELALAADWREDEDFTWRVVAWPLRHRLLGTEPLVDLGADEKKALGLEAGALAARVKGIPPNWVKQKNPSGAQFRKDDVIVDVDGRKDLEDEADVLAYLVKLAPGSTAKVTVLRAGKRELIELKLP